MITVTWSELETNASMDQNLLQILKNCGNFQHLLQIHSQILVHGLKQNHFLLPNLIDLSSGFHSLPYAVKIFENSQSPNLVAFNTMMKCFNGNGFPNESFFLYNRMRAFGISPNNFTFGFLLKACEKLESLQTSKVIHAQVMRCGFGFNVFVQNILLTVYSKCSDGLVCARHVFDEMLERDVVSWNSMIGACLSCGDMKQALCLFELMPERNIASWNLVITGLSRRGDMALARSVFERMTTRNSITWNTMITGYVLHGDVKAARSLFDRMDKKTTISWTAMISGYAKIGELESASELFDRIPAKNVVSWNAMISGYNQNGQFDKAMHTFQQMLLDAKLRPDEATLVSVVSACAQLGSLEQGNWIHSYIKKNDFILTDALGNALIDMFAKCGDIQSATLVFYQMPRRCIITWTSIVWGLAVNGRCEEALVLFNDVCTEGIIEPDDVIFIAVLTACTHGGLVEEGRKIFDRMVNRYSIEPRMEHYGCMVDLFGRSGRLKEAIQFINSMPVEPSAVIWATLLSSCMTHGIAEMTELAKQKIADIEPFDPAYQVLASNLGARGGRWEGVMDIRAAMRRRGIEKVPGCSSIQVGGEVHEFLVKDTKHKKRKEIYEALDGLTKLMRQLWHFPFRMQHCLLD